MKDIIRKSRSYRRFDETKKQTREVLLSIVEAARFSPSAGNMQRLRFRLVNEPEEVGQVSDDDFDLLMGILNRSKKK